MQVSRVAGGNGLISVHYSTSDLDAVAGVNYRATSGTLTWANGDVGDKTIAIEVLADTGTSPRGYKSFGLNFDSAQGASVYELNIELAVAAPSGVPPSSDASPPVASNTPAPATGAGSMSPAWLIALLVCTVLVLQRRLRKSRCIAAASLCVLLSACGDNSSGMNGLVLDTDGDPSNGIQISSAVTQAAATWAPVDFSSADLSTALAAIVQSANIAHGTQHVLSD